MNSQTLLLEPVSPARPIVREQEAEEALPCMAGQRSSMVINPGEEDLLGRKLWGRTIRKTALLGVWGMAQAVHQVREAGGSASVLRCEPTIQRECPSLAGRRSIKLDCCENE